MKVGRIRGLWENKYIAQTKVYNGYYEHYDKWGAMLYRAKENGEDMIKFYEDEKDYKKAIRGL